MRFDRTSSLCPDQQKKILQSCKMSPTTNAYKIPMDIQKDPQIVLMIVTSYNHIISTFCPALIIFIVHLPYLLRGTRILQR